MKESFLKYHYDNLDSSSRWIINSQPRNCSLLKIEIQELGDFLFSGNHYTYRGSLNSFQLMFSCENTTGKLEYDNKIYSFPQKGELMFIDCKKGYKINTSNMCHSVFVHFNGEGIQHFFDIFYKYNNSPIIKPKNEFIESNLKELISVYSVPHDIGADIYAQSLIFEILSNINKISLYQQKTYFSNEIQKVIDIIQNEYKKDLTLDSIANEIHLSKFSLHRQFKKETGNTIYEYLQSYRVNKAKGLLQNTNLSQDSICELVGIYDSSHLSKIFKKIENQTPNEYRKQWKLKNRSE